MSKEISLLIKQSIKGKEKAQIRIYDLYCESMYFIAFRYLKNEDEAKDAVQEGFLKAFLKLHSFKEAISFGSWLKRIIINHCIDVLKKKRINTVSIDDYSIEISSDDDWRFESTISKEMIIEAIDSLPQKHALILKLYLIEGYDHVEISEILQIKVKTSRTILHRGKLKLRETFKKEKHAARY